MASDIKDDAWKRAILLYQTGSQIAKIFKTLSNTGEDKDYKVALEKLNEYLEPQKNILHETFLFRQARQEKNETLARFHVRLRSLAERCEFGDRTDFEIKLQIVTHGTSSRLRKKALRDPKYTLKDMLLDGQREESRSKQNKVIEENLDKSAVDLNRVQTRKSKPRRPTLKSSSSSKCRQCGGVFPPHKQVMPGGWSNMPQVWKVESLFKVLPE